MFDMREGSNRGCDSLILSSVLQICVCFLNHATTVFYLEREKKCQGFSVIIW